MRLVDADNLIEWLRFNDVKSSHTPEITIMEFLTAAPGVKCETCKSWNGARLDDWGCCESDELSFHQNFNTQMSSAFGCPFYKRVIRT